MNMRASVVLLALGAAFMAAQAQQGSPATNDTQELGRRTFQQRCAVCHTRATLSVKKPYGPVLSADLLGQSWDGAKATILNGRPPKMPAFKYGLSTNEVDAIIEYLQTEPDFLYNGENPPAPKERKKLGAATVLLSGVVKSEDGKPIEGVPVSAKADGSSMTTTVFTDRDGRYYFPAVAADKYSVWAQTQAYETSKRVVDLAESRHEDFALRPLKDFFRQLSGDQLLSALPEDNATDKRLKQEFKHDCLGCHETSYILQNRFDEAGWNAIINVMKHETGAGVIGPEDQPPIPLLQYQQKELAAYLTRMRGPGPSPMKVQPQARPTGEAARVVFTEYDVPVDWSWDRDVMGGVLSNNGSDWSQGNPSSLNGGRGVHDAQADRDGNIWFSYNGVSRDRTIGKIDAATGELTNFALPGAPGLASMGHSLVLGPDGKIWFNINPRGPDYQAPEKLGGVDPKTGKVEVYTPPAGMMAPGGAVTMAVDGKGGVWVSASFGALRFDTATHVFKEFKSNTRVYEGVGNTYGVGGDRDGNGWWAQFYSALDTVSKGDVASGKTLDVKLTPVPGIKELFDAEELRMYKLGGSDQEAAYPWLEGPRRMGADPNGDVLWVCDYWGGNFSRIDTHTLKFDFIAAPNENMAPYASRVDDDHRLWSSFMNSDQVGRYDPQTGKWTMFRLPSMGTDVRWVSLHTTPDGHLQVVLPYFTSSRIARMTLRSEAEISALRERAKQSSAANRH